MAFGNTISCMLLSIIVEVSFMRKAAQIVTCLGSHLSLVPWVGLIDFESNRSDKSDFVEISWAVSEIVWIVFHLSMGGQVKDSQ